MRNMFPDRTNLVSKSPLNKCVQKYLFYKVCLLQFLRHTFCLGEFSIVYNEVSHFLLIWRSV